MGVLHWGTLRRFLTGDIEDRVILDVMDDFVWPQGSYPESFTSISSLEMCQERGVLHGGTWRTLRVPDRKLGGQSHPWCHGWPCMTQRNIPWMFHVDIFIRSVSRMGCHSFGYLVDVEGSWQETWKTGSSFMSWMTLFALKEDTLKFHSDIFIRSVSRMWVLHGGTWRIMRVPDRWLGGQGHSWCHGLPC